MRQFRVSITKIVTKIESPDKPVASLLAYKYQVIARGYRLIWARFIHCKRCDRAVPGSGNSSREALIREGRDDLVRPELEQYGHRHFQAIHCLGPWARSQRRRRNTSTTSISDSGVF